MVAAPLAIMTNELQMVNTDKKYKFTKKLLKLAIEASGYRNEDIAVKAGLSGKSVAQVSAWRNGRKEATERQMAYFIKEYGHLLKRKMEHLFYEIKINPKDEVLSSKYIKLSGEIIFKHQIRVLFSRKETVSLIRLLILQNEEGYKLITQYRAGLVRWSKHATSDYHSYLIDKKQDLVHGSNEDSNWFTLDLIDCKTVDDLIHEFDLFKNDLLKKSPFHPSARFNMKEIAPIEYAFFHKLMKLGLQSESMPF